MKLNIGCGARSFPGYKGVDIVKTPGADIVAPAYDLGLEPGSVDEIMAIHLIEHLNPWEIMRTFSEWFRVMESGGRLIIEAPDVFKACQNIAEGRIGKKHPDQQGMWALYGDPRAENPYMLHRWGYTFNTVQPLLSEVGFVDIVERPTHFHPVGREHRDFRVEARKP